MRTPLIGLILALSFASPALSWNGTGHEVVAGIAWDNMTHKAREKTIALLQLAPGDACMHEMFPQDGRPLAARQREYFIRVATWADVVRPARDQPDPRPCTRYHRSNWHFFDRFFSGTSGTAGDDAPKDRTDVRPAEVNAVERLHYFRPYVVCNMPACGTTRDERVTTLAWILHLVGDLHQPMHTASRVTTEPGEEKGDQGGNLFKLNPNDRATNLHSFWDGIVDASIARQPNESDIAYVNRVIGIVTHDHPRPSMAGRIEPLDPDAWSREGFAKAKALAYPADLVRGQTPPETYRQLAFKTADEAIALAGYRLGALMNKMFP